MRHKELRQSRETKHESLDFRRRNVIFVTSSQHNRAFRSARELNRMNFPKILQKQQKLQELKASNKHFISCTTDGSVHSQSSSPYTSYLAK